MGTQYVFPVLETESLNKYHLNAFQITSSDSTVRASEVKNYKYVCLFDINALNTGSASLL